VAAVAAVAGLSDGSQLADRSDSVNPDRCHHIVFGDFQTPTNESLAATSHRGASSASAGAFRCNILFEQDFGHFFVGQ